MGAYGSISPGYDPGYLLRETSKGSEGYYLSAVDEIGEPPGVWTGRACPVLGLEIGGHVEPYAMEAIYGRLLDPRDPAFADMETPDADKAHLGKAPRNYRSISERYAALVAAEPGAAPERLEELAIEARQGARQAVLFLDFTFSVDKSTSVLHASLQAAAADAEHAGEAGAAAEYRRQADTVEQAIRAGSAAAVEYLQDVAGYSRSGYHGGVPKDARGRALAEHGTGRWTDAHEWVVASFFQHTSRDGDPQLHVHNAILNRAENEDGTWRTIDSRAVFKARAAASAIGGRVMDEMISRELGAAYEQRADGHGRELAGVEQAVKDMFSSRRAAITARVAELAAGYQERHGRPPNARALFSMAQFVTLDSRRAKPRKGHAPTRAEMLDDWAARMSSTTRGALEGIPASVIGTRDAGAAGIEEMAGEEIGRVLSAAVAEAQAARAVWGRSQLLAAIDAHLPGWLGGLDAATVRYVLDDLTDRALAGGHGVVSLEAPDLVPMPASLVRADGRSVFTPHDRCLYSTASHLEAEEALAHAAAETGGAPAADPAQAARALGAAPAELDALPGRRPPAAAGVIEEEDQGDGREYAGLRADQAAAVWGILTSARPVDVLIGPAGSGKSRTMGTLSELWAELAGGDVVGVATSENAAQVLAAEGVSRAQNIARFLGAAARGEAVLRAGDLLIVDEAGMVPTADLTALHAIAAEAGAKVLLTGDPAQLASVGAGGALGMLARDAGYYQLTQVARMRAEWERAASLRLRDGDASVLADYDRHGRLAEGTDEQMGEAAYRGWLADHLSGLDALLIASTNEQAAALSARARAELAALGQVQADAPLPLSDGNAAGLGDMIQARRNNQRIRDRAGRWIANRDMLRVEGYEEGDDGEARTVTVRRDMGRDPATGERQWSDPFAVPASYLAANAVLGYAGTAHSSQGRTADTSHGVMTEALTRALAYVMLTRGRQANYAYVVVDRPAGQAPKAERPLGDDAGGQQPGADLRAGDRPAPALDEPGREVPESWRGHARATAAERADSTDPWAPEADRITVLAAILERDGADRTARDTRLDEAERAGHMAHMGAIWTDLATEEAGRRYDAIMQQALTPEQYQRYQAEEARGTLHRQARAAELAGHSPEALLPAAVAIRSLDNAPHRGAALEISEVLHWRIEHEMIGRPAPRPATFAERTPQAADPERARVLADLAERLDERTADLGARTAQQPPQWAIDRLGPVPEDPEGRRAWARRAAPVAAYREQYGYTDPVRPIGREPAAPEARAAWRAAAVSLGRDPAELELTAASDGELHRRRDHWERELAWAPPHVGQSLRAAVHARREHQAEAVLARARAGAAEGPDRDRAEARATAHARLAASLQARENLLTEIDTQRARWHEATRDARDQAEAATAELRRRGAQAPGYRDPHQRADPPEPAPAPEPDGRDHLDDEAGLRRAAERAALARQVLDQRERRAAAERAELEERQRDDRPRWPDRPFRAPGRTDASRPGPGRARPGRRPRPEELSFPRLATPRPPSPAERPAPARRPPAPERDGPGMAP